jgi:hypothetical protein
MTWARRATALVVAIAALGCSYRPAGPPASPLPALPRESSPSDFDFAHGEWSTRLRRLEHPLSGAQSLHQRLAPPAIGARDKDIGSGDFHGGILLG